MIFWKSESERLTVEYLDLIHFGLDHNFADTDIMQVIVCVLLYFALLSAVLRHLPQCFTIGEAMIVTQSVVLLSVDAFTDLGIKVHVCQQEIRSFFSNFHFIQSGVTNAFFLLVIPCVARFSQCYWNSCRVSEKHWNALAAGKALTVSYFSIISKYFNLDFYFRWFYLLWHSEPQNMICILLLAVGDWLAYDRNFVVASLLLSLSCKVSIGPWM